MISCILISSFVGSFGALFVFGTLLSSSKSSSLTFSTLSPVVDSLLIINFGLTGLLVFRLTSQASEKTKLPRWVEV